MACRSSVIIAALLWLSHVQAVVVPSTPPSDAVTVDPSLVSVSIEFFAFPGYTNIAGTNQCLDNIARLRGVQPAVRIGGTTQYASSYVSPIVSLYRGGRRIYAHRDRATYDANLKTAVNYTVADPADAPLSLTYGPSFFSLASQLKGSVIVGLNRQLNNQGNSLSAAQAAKSAMGNLFAIELGNEPDCERVLVNRLRTLILTQSQVYSSGSPIASGTGWSNSIDIQNEAKWFTALAPSVSVVCTRHLIPIIILTYIARQYLPRGRIPVMEHANAHPEHRECSIEHYQEHLPAFVSPVGMRWCEH